MKFGSANTWRETQRPARFLCFDARITLFIGLTLLHFRLWTVILLIAAALVLLWMDWKGIDPANAMRHLHGYLNGPHIPARPWSELRMPVDYGFEIAGSPVAPPDLRDVAAPEGADRDSGEDCHARPAGKMRAAAHRSATARSSRASSASAILNRVPGTCQLPSHSPSRPSDGNARSWHQSRLAGPAGLPDFPTDQLPPDMDVNSMRSDIH